MLEFLSKSRLGPIGLDVGAEGVKMIQLSASGGRLKIAAAGHWHFPDALTGAVADPANRRRLVTQGVTELLKSGDFRGRKVVSCLRTSELSIKNIRLPHMSEAELAKAIPWECQERLGFEVSPDRVHYVNAGEVRTGTEVHDEILLMAVTAQTVQDHLELLDEMRLFPLNIDSEPTALLRAYERYMRRTEDASAVTVLLDLGLSATRVVIARGQTLLLIKAIDIAGRNFNESVARELSLPHAEAAHIRRRGGASSGNGQAPSGDQVQWSVIDAIRGQAEALAHEIALCLRYCSVTFRGLRPSRIILTGGEAYDAALVKLLGEQLNCECIVGEPLKGIDLAEAKLGSDRRCALTEWSVAVGLALRDLPCAEAKKEDNELCRIPA